MSDLRVSYAPFDEDPQAFASQQMQVASVRVVGAESPEQEKAIFDAHRQIISRFFRACDQQHRLAGRGHTQFRMSADGVDLRYVNNAGQPLIFVTPEGVVAPEEERRRPEIPVVEPVPAGWVILNVEERLGTDTDEGEPRLSGSVSIAGRVTGQTVTQDAPQDGTRYKRMVVFFSDTSINDPEQFARAQFNEQSGYDYTYINYVFQTLEDTPTTFVTLPSADGPRFEGVALGYLAAETGQFVAYPMPQNVYSLEVSVTPSFAKASAVSKPMRSVSLAFLQLTFNRFPLDEFTSMEYGNTAYMEKFERETERDFSGGWDAALEIVGPYARYASGKERTYCSGSSQTGYQFEYRTKLIEDTRIIAADNSIISSTETISYGVTVTPLGYVYPTNVGGAPVNQIVSEPDYYQASLTQEYYSDVYASDRWSTVLLPSGNLTLAEHNVDNYLAAPVEYRDVQGSDAGKFAEIEAGSTTILKLTNIPTPTGGPVPQGIILAVNELNPPESD